jgi:hypothetical protein
MKLFALVSLGLASTQALMTPQENKDFTRSLTYKALGFKGVSDSTVDCVVDINNSVYALEQAVWSFEQGDYPNISQGVVHVGETISAIGKAMVDCAEPKDSAILAAQSEILEHQHSLEVSLIEETLKVNEVNIFEEVHNAVTAFQNENYAAVGDALGEAARKVFVQAELSPEFCVCDNTFEMMTGFANGIQKEVNTEGVLTSLKTKSMNYQNSIKAVFDPALDLTDELKVRTKISEFSIKTLYLFHELTADGAFVTEANSVHPTLRCMGKIAPTMNENEHKLFAEAQDNYNNGHWYFAGQSLAMLGKAMCQEQNPTVMW